jgi:hypothetical protein
LLSILDLNNIFSVRWVDTMPQKSMDKSNKPNTIINKKAILVTIALYFTILIVFEELTPARVAAQLILNKTNSSMYSNDYKK